MFYNFFVFYMGNEFFIFFVIKMKWFYCNEMIVNGGDYCLIVFIFRYVFSLRFYNKIMKIVIWLYFLFLFLLFFGNLYTIKKLYIV